jgi:hypothetical protein
VLDRQILDVRGVDVVAAADDQVFLAPDDLQIALGVEAPEVAGEKPAARVERILGGALVVEVAERQQRAARADLAELAGFRFDVRDFPGPTAAFRSRGTRARRWS